MRVPAGVSLLGPGLDGLSGPLNPDDLGAVHPVWAADVAAYGPWSRDGQGLYRAAGAPDGAPLCVCGPCASALDVAWALVRAQGLPEWGAVLATAQSAGRGQLRRAWSGAPGDILAAWRWPLPPGPWAPLLPLLVGAVVADELAARGAAVRIKWPNDLLVDGCKVGGILVEERGGVVVAGLGLNLGGAPRDHALRDARAPRAVCLEPATAIKSIFGLWRSLVERAENWYILKVSGGSPAQFLEDLTLRLAWVGREVRVCEAESEFTARLLGLAPDGGLVLERAGRRVTLHSGSVFLP